MDCFRPLSGYLISKWFDILFYRHSVNTVSVPSRGILFPNRYNENLVKAVKAEFPSPLGVSYFQIYIVCIYYQKRGFKMFPSPLGVSYFQILPARARYFTGFSDSFAWQIIFLYIFLISNIHNRLQMQYLCGARQNYLFF